MTEEARPATVDDVGEVVALYRAAVAEALPKRGGEALWAAQGRLDPETDLAAMVEDPEATLVVGTIDDVIVGFGAAHRRPSVEGPPVAVVTEIFTLPDARGVGVGEAMFEALGDWARAQGCGAIDSQALPGDRNTKNFFETFGVVARAITVSSRLDES